MELTGANSKVTHRRYYEWFLSYHNQAHKAGHTSEEGISTNLWPSPSTADLLQGGTNRIQTIKDYYHRLTSSNDTSFSQRWGTTLNNTHPAFAVHSKLSRRFPVSVFNFHAQRNIVQAFYCQLMRGDIPPAPNACRGAGDHHALRRNPSHDRHDYDILAVAALDRGLLNPGRYNVVDARKWVVDHARSFHRKKMEEDARRYALPLVCMDDGQLKELLALSLLYEDLMLDDGTEGGWAETHRREHVEGFKKAVGQDRFCSVDVDKALKKHYWRDFFINF